MDFDHCRSMSTKCSMNTTRVSLKAGVPYLHVACLSTPCCTAPTSRNSLSRKITDVYQPSRVNEELPLCSKGTIRS
jgi:hypothetical protein